MRNINEFVCSNEGLIKAIFKKIDESRQALIARTREIAEIPSPTFHEEKKSRYVQDALTKAGLGDVHSLPRGSVLGFTRSKGEGGTLLLAAHIDTVFPIETDLTTRMEDSLLHGPGTGDNAANVSAIIRLAEILSEMEVRPDRNIAFCGTVREEGTGNLGGMAEVLQFLGDRVQTVVAVDGRTPSLMHRSQAIRRFALKIGGPGGHAWEHFGTPSPIHEMAKAITKLASLELPEEPRTTFNVGMINGGRSVNAIAQECVAQVEFRSLEPDRVDALVREFLKITEEIPAPDLEVSVELIGTRPGGLLPPENPLVQTAAAAAEYLGLKAELKAASTDAALALAQGIPSICMGTYRGNGVHTLQEKVETDSLTTGSRWLALTVLALAGIEK